MLLSGSADAHGDGGNPTRGPPDGWLPTPDSRLPILNYWLFPRAAIGQMAST